MRVMLFWGQKKKKKEKIFCFDASERHGVTFQMLLCDNSLKRAAGRKWAIITDIFNKY